MDYPIGLMNRSPEMFDICLVKWIDLELAKNNVISHPIQGVSNHDRTNFYRGFNILSLHCKI